MSYLCHLQLREIIRYIYFYDLVLEYVVNADILKNTKQNL